jgi:predicted secreted Zn-dependent protease
MTADRSSLKWRRCRGARSVRLPAALLLITLIVLACLLAGCGSPVKVGSSSASAPGSTAPTALATAPVQSPPSDPYYKNAEPVPGVRVTEMSKFYDFGGSTPEVMRQKINDVRPKEYDAWTNWDLSYDYSPVKGSKGYITSNPSVTLKVSYTLPKWDRPQGASRQTADSWNKYAADLSRHELGHRMIAVDFANKILQDLQPGNVFPSEKALHDAEDEVFAGLLEQCNEAEAAYDDATDHGAAQGARFP